MPQQQQGIDLYTQQMMVEISWTHSSKATMVPSAP